MMKKPMKLTIDVDFFCFIIRKVFMLGFMCAEDRDLELGIEDVNIFEYIYGLKSLWKQKSAIEKQSDAPSEKNLELIKKINN